MPAADLTPSRRTSRILFWYVAREYAVPLFCCLAGFTLLFVILDLFDVLQDLVGADAGTFGVMRYFLLRQPANLVLIFPIAILLSAGYLISNFSRHHELTAVRACGVSMARAFLPVWIFAALFTGVSYWLNESLAASCTEQADELFRDLTEKPAERLRRQLLKPNILVFKSSRSHREWLFERFDRDGEQVGVLLRQYREDGRAEWEARAEKAVYVRGMWVLRTVVKAAYDEEGLLPASAGEPVAELEIAARGDSPKDILSSMKPADRLNIRDMLRILRVNPDLPKSTRDVFRTAIWFRGVFPLSCLGAALFGISLSVSPQGGSRLRGFALAVGLLIGFYFFSQMAVWLGKVGLLPPILAGAVPTVVFTLWGAWYLWRKR